MEWPEASSLCCLFLQMHQSIPTGAPNKRHCLLLLLHSGKCSLTQLGPQIQLNNNSSSILKLQVAILWCSVILANTQPLLWCSCSLCLWHISLDWHRTMIDGKRRLSNLIKPCFTEKPIIVSLSLCTEFMRVSSSLSDQYEVEKITFKSGKDFSYHDDSGNYAQGLTPIPLPAVKLYHLSVLDHFFKGTNFVCIGNLVMNAIKNPKRSRWVWERQLVFSCMELLVLQSAQVWWELWPSEDRAPESSRDGLLYVFWNAVHSNIVCLWGCLAHTQRCLLFVDA